MNQNGGMLIIHFDDGKARQIFCENVNCTKAKIDHAFSWGQAIDQLGWKFERADKINSSGNEKLSGINPLLCSSGELISAYCPLCKEVANHE